MISLSLRGKIGLAFVTGGVTGACASLALMGLFQVTPPEFVLTESTQLSSLSSASGSLTGPVPAGTHFRLQMRKAGVNYIQFQPIAFDKDLLNRSRSVGPSATTPWDRDLQWRQSHSQGPR